MKNDKIIIKGAKENNLKNIDLVLPRERLIVFSGVSGCGKSTLAFDTIFAEGQRRYMESLSSYARQFLGQMQKPDAESISGLSPAISIDQKTTSHNPRSTVGTVTEIYDYLRLFYAKAGRAFCPNCHKPISCLSVDQIVEKIMQKCMGKRTVILSPVVYMQKGTHTKTLEKLKAEGILRVCINGETYNFDDYPDCNFAKLEKNKKHNIFAVCDRISLKSDGKSRLSESVEFALNLSNGIVVCECDKEQVIYSTNHSCPECGFAIPEITPRLFSFNAVSGACPNCDGIGATEEVDLDILMKNKHLSIMEGAFSHCGYNPSYGPIAISYFKSISKKHGIPLYEPVENLTKKQLDIILYGTTDSAGIVQNMKKRYHETESEFFRREIGKLFKTKTCPVCHGKRLSNLALCIKVEGMDIAQMCQKSVDWLLKFFQNLTLDGEMAVVCKQITKEIISRLNFLKNVGLDYLTLSRQASTLSGGESQRIRLASQIGSGLVGVLYILDEPSIGLHQDDNEKLISTLKNLRDLGNTVIVVEHDQSTILSADHVVDIGPLAGSHGGEIVAQGTPKQIMACKNSLTGKYLSGEMKIEQCQTQKEFNKGWIKVFGAKLNNLKNINVQIPLGSLCVVSGKSGSGKSSLVDGIIYPHVAKHLGILTEEMPGSVSKIEGIENIDKVVLIDQSPIGRTPRSNPATYTGVFSAIRELFANTQKSKERGYKSGRFSFNIKGGRCEACQGDGEKTIEMYFLPDVTVPCEVCHGMRYNSETLEVKFKGKNIFDVLDMTCQDALLFFENLPSIKNKIKALCDVGLGYIKLGQSSTTLSGGEAQRVKLATELAKKQTGKTLYILDEPSTGLHPYDVQKLINILSTLVSKGNTAIVVEHNIDIIKCADYIIDLGPEGGDKGGQVVVQGTLEEVAKCKKSLTAKYLR